MKKIEYSYLVMALQMMIITFFIIILSSVTIIAESQSFLNNKMFTSYVKGINLKDDTLDFSKITDYAGRNTVIYKYLSEENHIKRAIYCSSDIIGFDQYIENGRFFSNEDCNSNYPLAVIGHNVLSDIIEKNGEMYYGHNETLYKVIGVFRKTDSDLDSVVYINLSYIFEVSGSAGIYYIDSTNSENVTQTVNHFLEHINTVLFEYEQPKNDMNVSHKIKFLLAIITAFCNLVITAHYFILKQEYKIAVKKMCGYSNKDMVLKYIGNISLIAIISYALGCGLAIILTNITLSFSESKFAIDCFVVALIISNYSVTSENRP